MDYFVLSRLPLCQKRPAAPPAAFGANGPLRGQFADVWRNGHSEAGPVRYNMLRLLPKSLVLDEVAVRLGKTEVLSAAFDKGGWLARCLHPEQAVNLFTDVTHGVGRDAGTWL